MPGRRDRHERQEHDETAQDEYWTADVAGPSLLANVHRLMRRQAIEERLRRPAVVGVLNVTPDSFSDGGVHLEAEDAAAAARQMFADGAVLVDVGGESTRPGADAVAADEELERVLPVLQQLAEIPFSIDTTKSDVARRALELGAVLVNDVTALRGDPDLAGVVAEHGALLCLMHMQGEPRTMQVDPRYDDVVSDVVAFLDERLTFAVSQGIPEDCICLDPGIGFGKTPSQNLELVRRLEELVALGRPVLVGLSRKSTLGKLLGDTSATVGSDAASVGAAVAAFDRGASIFRVHDVRSHVEALAAAAAVERGMVPA
jgi:dihydropteroate synthase